MLSRARRHEAAIAVSAFALACLGGVSSSPLPAASAATGPQVLLVGSYKGIKGQFRSLEAAVKAARPGAWVLVGPGDYKDLGTHVPRGARTDDRAGAQVLIHTNGIHIRGMDRNRVIIDGTKPGGAPCSRARSAQYLGPVDAAGKRSGRSGILIYKARDVTVENLTLCNFLTGDLGGGNQIWWDGGAGTGTQADMGYWHGTYLTATSYYYGGSGKPAGS